VNADAIETAMTRLKEGTSGKLYDAMGLGVKCSAAGHATPTHPGARVILVLAEAHDEGSNAKLGEVLRARNWPT